MTTDTHIPVVIGSTRRGRVTPRVAAFIVSRLQAHGLQPSIVDLAKLNLPILEERLMYLENPPPAVVQWGQTVEQCRALVVVSPEYNGGCPGVLKNAIDYLRPEYKDKSVGIIAVSNGPHGGAGCLERLTRTFTRLKATPLQSSFKINNAGDTFSADGTTTVQEYHTAADALAAELAAALH